MKLCAYRTILFLTALLMVLQSHSAKAGEPDFAFHNHLRKLQQSAGQVGIQVLSLAPVKVIWEFRSEEPLVPASLVKVLTSYAALKYLKPQYQFRTSLYALDDPRGDTVRGHLWIKSAGDIFLLGENLKDMALRLKERGIRIVQGGVFADNSFFNPQAEQICLDERCASSYNPVVSATSIEFNTIAFTVSGGAKSGTAPQVSWFPPGDYVQVDNLARTASKKAARVGLAVRSAGMTGAGRERFRVTGKVGPRRNFEYRLNVDDPASFVARSFKEVLRREGIEVRGADAGPGTVPPGAKPLVTHESRALGDIIYGLNRYSNNFMAEMLLRSLGGLVLGPPGTVDKGVELVRKSLVGLGVPPHEVQLKSGSGLSRECRASARAFCTLLASAYADPSIEPDFISSFATNGSEGTLRRRLCKPDVEVRGKTGTLRDVVGFAGYVAGCGRGPYVVTVILNDVSNIGEARRALDGFLEQVPLIAPSM